MTKTSTMDLLIYEYETVQEPVEQFLEMLHQSDLRYSTMDLVEFGIDSPAEIECAVERAMMACRSEGLPLDEHFKAVYIEHHGESFRLWRLSQIAFRLAVINANTSHPRIAHLQMELLTRIKNDDL